MSLGYLARLFNSRLTEIKEYLPLSFSFSVSLAILHSTTLLLPLWFRTLGMLNLAERKMPRDVSTRWNSTYDMLDFAVGYQSAIDDMTGDKTTNLRKYELDDGEWKIAEQLRDTLKVHVSQRPHLANKFPI